MASFIQLTPLGDTVPSRTLLLRLPRGSLHATSVFHGVFKNFFAFAFVALASLGFGL